MLMLTRGLIQPLMLLQWLLLMRLLWLLIVLLMWLLHLLMLLLRLLKLLLMRLLRLLMLLMCFLRLLMLLMLLMVMELAGRLAFLRLEGRDARPALKAARSFPRVLIELARHLLVPSVPARNPC